MKAFGRFWDHYLNRYEFLFCCWQLGIAFSFSHITFDMIFIYSSKLIMAEAFEVIDAVV